MARRIRALTPERVDELPGACACCALWEGDSMTSPECGVEADVGKLVAWISMVRSEWGDCGRVAFVDGEPIGLIKYAPPRFFHGLSAMPSGLPSDDAVLIACLRISGDARHAGLGKVLLQAALRDLSSRGEKCVEAYAAADPVDRERTPLMSVEFLLRQGFSVLRPHPRYPIMRLELKSLVAWTDNVEAVLEALQLPRRVTERVPAPSAVPPLPGVHR